MSTSISSLRIAPSIDAWPSTVTDLSCSCTAGVRSSLVALGNVVIIADFGVESITLSHRISPIDVARKICSYHSRHVVVNYSSDIEPNQNRINTLMQAIPSSSDLRPGQAAKLIVNAWPVKLCCLARVLGDRKGG